ncbi:MAG: hypothetical protein M3367_05895 [Acidobacteriota bacterium]|nr:hypothetical protein [Acidobacteriota bacterium]
MANQGLAFSDASGGNRGYNGLWIGDVSSPFGASGSSTLFREAFHAARKDDVLPTVVNVAAGVPILSGSLMDEDGISTPPGVIVTVTKPDGTALDVSSSVYTDDLMIHLDAENTLSAFMIKNPAVGNWTISTQIPGGSEPNFQLFVATMPTGTGDESDMQATLQSAFQDRFSPEQIDGFVEKYGLGSAGCVWCTIGVWIIAAAIAVILLAATAVLTVESGCVVTLALAAKATAEASLFFIRGLLGLVGAGVGALASKICGWIGACDSALDTGITEMSPQGGY